MFLSTETENNPILNGKENPACFPSRFGPFVSVKMENRTGYSGVKKAGSGLRESDLVDDCGVISGSCEGARACLKVSVKDPYEVN